MTGGAVLKAAAAGATRRLVQTVVIFVVLAMATTAALVGLTLAAIPTRAFQAVSARNHTADLAVTIDAAKVTRARLAATGHLPGVTGAVGYPATTVSITIPATPGYQGGQPVSAYPATAHLTAGRAIHITVGGTTVTATITGTVYSPGIFGALLTSWQTLRGAAGLAVSQYIVALRPGIEPPAYADALGKTLGHGYDVENIVPGQSGSVSLYGDIDTSLIRLLTILVAVLAGLGVLNATLMLTRQRVHDLGIYKAVGMTPRQTIAMVTCWAIAPAVAAAVMALPAGMALQNAVMHAIAADQAGQPQTLSIPPGSLVHVYTPAGSPCSPSSASPSPSSAPSAQPPGPPSRRPPPPCAPNNRSRAPRR